MLVVLYMCIPFKEESERNKEYGGCGLSIEDKDEIVHAMVKCSFWEKKHASIDGFYEDRN